MQHKYIVGSGNKPASGAIFNIKNEIDICAFLIASTFQYKDYKVVKITNSSAYKREIIFILGILKISICYEFGLDSFPGFSFLGLIFIKL